jgi:hypothetical protein
MPGTSIVSLYVTVHSLKSITVTLVPKHGLGTLTGQGAADHVSQCFESGEVSQDSEQPISPCG